MLLNPVFVHASPRSGSTYVFNGLRRDKKLYCYNEAISDVYSHAKSKLQWDANHHFLDGDDDKEIRAAIGASTNIYPECPSFRDYMTVSPELRRYFDGLLEFSRVRQKRPVFCEIYSRCRAPELKKIYGGLHVAQYRDPLCQFGSFVRALEDGGEWGFLVFPIYELGLGGKPLHDSKLPKLPWPMDSARRWVSSLEYMVIAAKATPRQLLEWHLRSWFLGNMMAMSVSDICLDIDQLHDDMDYRSNVEAVFYRQGISVGFADVRKYQRYYAFEDCDLAELCEEVTNSIEARFAKLLKAFPFLKISHFEILMKKLLRSLGDHRAGVQRTFGDDEWRDLIRRHSPSWFNPALRQVGGLLRTLARH